MLTISEDLYVRILRGTVVATAAVALLVTTLAIAYAGYAYFAPDPRARLSLKVERLRSAANPSRLLTDLFPKAAHGDVGVNGKKVDILFDNRRSSLGSAFVQFNKFLDVVFGAGFESEQKFKDWFVGAKAIPISWSKAIDDETTSGLDNALYVSSPSK